MGWVGEPVYVSLLLTSMVQEDNDSLFSDYTTTKFISLPDHECQRLVTSQVPSPCVMQIIITTSHHLPGTQWGWLAQTNHIQILVTIHPIQTKFQMITDLNNRKHFMNQFRKFCLNLENLIFERKMKSHWDNNHNRKGI